MSQSDHDLLQQIANDVKHIVKWSDEHNRTDNIRFDAINKKLFWGAIAFIIIASATGVLPQLIGHLFKVGA